MKKICIVSPFRRDYRIKRLIETFSRKDIFIERLNLNQLFFANYSRIRSNIMKYDVILLLTFHYKSHESWIFRSEIINHSLEKGVKFINKPYPTFLTNKFSTLVRWEKRFNMPKTFIIERLDIVEKIFNKLTKDVVIKPVFGNSGENIYHITRKNRLKQLVKDNSSKGIPTIIQEYIPHDFSVRVTILNNEILSVVKQKPNKTWLTNECKGGVVSRYKIDPSIGKKCIEATQILNLDFAGIDLIKSNNNGRYYFLEANAFPGWETEDKMGFQITEKLAHFVTSNLD